MGRIIGPAIESLRGALFDEESNRFDRRAASISLCVIRRIGGRKSHPDFHRVHASALSISIQDGHATALRLARHHPLGRSGRAAQTIQKEETTTNGFAAYQRWVRSCPREWCASGSIVSSYTVLGSSTVDPNKGQNPGPFSTLRGARETP
jgi:hypothetical protein